MLLHTLFNRIQYSINITCVLGNQIIHVFCFIAWTRAEPTISPRHACHQGGNSRHSVYRVSYYHLYELCNHNVGGSCPYDPHFAGDGAKSRRLNDSPGSHIG